MRGPNAEALASLALLPLQAVVAIVCALAFFPFALFALLGLFFGVEKFLWFEIWCAASALICVRNIAACFESMNDPQPKSLAMSLAWTGIIVAASPLWWR